MKEHLEKKLKRVCDSIGTQAAAEKFQQLSESIDKEYDKRIAGGMSELDAYREMLRDIDAIEALLKELPKNESEKRRKSERRDEGDWKRWTKKLDSIESSIQSIMWLLTVIVFFLMSFATGRWHLTWLIFLLSSITSIIIDMLFKYNKGVPVKKLIKRLHGIMWLAISILYFFISFTFGGWAVTWLLFIVGAILDIVINAVSKMMD